MPTSGHEELQEGRKDTVELHQGERHLFFETGRGKDRHELRQRRGGHQVPDRGRGDLRDTQRYRGREQERPCGGHRGFPDMRHRLQYLERYDVGEHQTEQPSLQTCRSKDKETGKKAGGPDL